MAFPVPFLLPCSGRTVSSPISAARLLPEQIFALHTGRPSQDFWSTQLASFLPLPLLTQVLGVTISVFRMFTFRRCRLGSRLLLAPEGLGTSSPLLAWAKCAATGSGAPVLKNEKGQRSWPAGPRLCSDFGLCTAETCKKGAAWELTASSCLQRSKTHGLVQAQVHSETKPEV